MIATIAIIVVILIITLWWWRYRSLACPAALSWLIENRFYDRLCSPELLLQRLELKERMRLLDVGCGTGRVALVAAEWLGGSGEVTALDIQQRMLDKLRNKMQRRVTHNLHLLCAAAGGGEVEKGYYDRVVMVAVLGEIRDKEAALGEVFAALQQGGLLAVCETMLDPHYVSRKRLQQLCEAAGFHEVATYRQALGYTRIYLRP